MSRQVKKIYVHPILSDEELDKKKGEYFPESHYSQIINEDCDVYCLDSNMDGDKPKLLLKFRKGVIDNSICSDAFWALQKHAQNKNHNRGAASGKLNLKKLPAYVGKVMKKGSFRVFYKSKSGKIVRDNVGNFAMSNIAGYYDKPDRNNYAKLLKYGKSATQKMNSHRTNAKRSRITTDKLGIPMCRTTKFTAQEVDKWRKCLPLIDAADHWFAKLVPDRHKTQLQRAAKTPDFQIGKTAYSTITVNYNWRTALHKDVGDLADGFGNLIVLELHKSGANPDENQENQENNTSTEKNVDNHIKKANETCNYKGGYLGFPKYGVAVDVRQGDFLAMDVHQWHCNTPIEGVVKGCNYGRLSVVCYLREKMIKCIKTSV